jgi:hypothetical protein
MPDVVMLLHCPGKGGECWERLTLWTFSNLGSRICSLMYLRLQVTLVKKQKRLTYALTFDFGDKR